jgi:hypothetical protein
MFFRAVISLGHEGHPAIFPPRNKESRRAADQELHIRRFS